jgi:hypothetical protein
MWIKQTLERWDMKKRFPLKGNHGDEIINDDLNEYMLNISSPIDLHSFT